MANVRGQAIDKTHLSIDQAEARGFIHRDYIAHCLRWSHVVKYLLQGHKYKSSRILDIGCGREFPLAKTLYTSKMSPKFYMGMDVNKLERPAMFADKTWFTYTGQTDAAQYSCTEKFDVITCFEVLEHVEPAHSRELLKAIHRNLSDNGITFISTPVWDPHVGAAGNHVNEIKYYPLMYLMESLDFQIEAVYGTFASQSDLRPHLQSDPVLWSYFNQLKEYYDSNYLATVFAPLFPYASRNCLWEVSKGFRKSFDDSTDVVDFSVRNYRPWTSSEKWADLLPEVNPND